MTPYLLIMLAAIVCFLLAAFNAPTKINTGWLGMALFALAAVLANQGMLS